MRSASAVLLLTVGLAACGDQQPSADERVGPDVKGSGEVQLLADDGFRRSVEAAGVRADAPPGELGLRIGQRLRALGTDIGRLAISSFTPA